VDPINAVAKFKLAFEVVNRLAGSMPVLLRFKTWGAIWLVAIKFTFWSPSTRGVTFTTTLQEPPPGNVVGQLFDLIAKGDRAESRFMNKEVAGKSADAPVWVRVYSTSLADPISTKPKEAEPLQASAGSFFTDANRFTVARPPIPQT